MTSGLAAACLVAAALVVGAGRPAGRERLRVLVPDPDPGTGAASGVDRLRLAAAGAGVAAFLLVGGWPGPVVGIVVAVATDRALRRLEPRARRADRERAGADLPFGADLLAAVLLAGAPVASAVGTVAGAMDEPLAARLAQVSRALALGTPAAEAWAPLADLPEAVSLVRAAVRSSESGSALAAALSRTAGELRSGRDARAEEAARRASVLVVLPLGLCFLPAFVLLGVVPVVVGVLDDVLV